MGKRLRSNFKYGTLSAAVTSGATTLTSTGFADLPVVASPNILAIVLDPESTSPEVAWVTAHTAASQSVTVTRGQETTAAKAHAINTRWIHPLLAEDVDVIKQTVHFFNGGVLAQGEGRGRIYFGAPATVVGVRASLGVPAGGQSVIADLNKGSGEGDSSTIYTTQANRPTITAGNHYSGTATLPNTVSIAAGDFLQCDIDQVGVAPTQSVVATATYVPDPGTANATVTSFDIPIPASIATGDVLLCVANIGGTTADHVASLSTPDGWTYVSGATINDFANGLTLVAFVKVATGDQSTEQSEDRTVSWDGSFNPVAVATIAARGTSSTLGFADNNTAATSAATIAPDGGTPSQQVISVVVGGWRPSGNPPAQTTATFDSTVTERADIVTARTGSTANAHLALGTIATSVALSATQRTITGSASARSGAMLINLDREAVESGEDLMVQVEYTQP